MGPTGELVVLLIVVVASAVFGSIITGIIHALRDGSA